MCQAGRGARLWVKPEPVRQGEGILGAAAAADLSSHLQLCDPIDCSPPGSSVHGSLQARVLEWGAMASSRGSS